MGGSGRTVRDGEMFSQRHVEELVVLKSWVSEK